MTKTDSSNVVPLSAHRSLPAVAPTVIGVIVGWSEARGPVVDYEGNPHGPLAAITVLALEREQVEALVETRRPVVLAFEGARADRPIILGLVQPLRSPTSEAREAPSSDQVEVEAAPGLGRPSHAVVDGETISLQASKEIELRCGKASITLTRAGKIVIRGAHVVTHSSGANRIRGGSVELN